MKIEHKNILLYIAKAVTGTLLLLSFGELLHIPDMSWVIISMLLVLSPDSKEAIPLTIVRVKANLMASIATMIFLLLFPNVTLAICLAITVTILLCYAFNLMTGSRAALAAVVIIAQHPAGIHLWSTAEERVLAVVVGCAMGLVLTYVFHRDLPLKDTIFPKNSSE